MNTLLMIGTSFPYIEFLPEPGQAKSIQIDSDAARIGLRYPVQIGLVGDARTTLAALAPLLKQKTDKNFLVDSQERMKSWNDLMTERGTRQDVPMKPQAVTHTLNKLLNDDAIISADSGTVATWTARYIESRGDMMFHYPVRLPRWATDFLIA